MPKTLFERMSEAQSMTTTPTEGVTQADIIERDWALKVNAETIARQKAEVERLREALRIFLGCDDRFQVMVGGNPIAVEQMLENARALAGES